jgi:DNA-cytosine methyltransferase
MINVLSCFDGLSGGQLALERAGIKVGKYFASEIDKFAIAVAKYNYPNMIHLGDVRGIDADALPKIDLMLAGSPCTDLSFAGLGKGLIDGEQSSLFFDWWKLVKKIKPKYIFLENVRMKQEYQDMISEILGFQPIAINSALVSAQNRFRLYWFGVRDGDTYKAIPVAQPKDKGIILAHILEEGLDDTWTLSDKAQERAKDNTRSRAFMPNQKKSGALLSNQYKQSTDSLYALANGCIQVGETAEIKGYDIIKRVYSPEGKAPTLTTMQGGHREPKVATNNPNGGVLIYQQPRGWNKGGLRAKDGKTPSLTTSSWEHNNHLTDGLRWRKLTPKECARLQTVPDDHCSMGSFDGIVKPISKSQQYKMLGNGWTIDVITHILEGMKDV